MSANVFRSNLMQQFVATAARTSQHTTRSSPGSGIPSLRTTTSQLHTKKTVVDGSNNISKEKKRSEKKKKNRECMISTTTAASAASGLQPLRSSHRQGLFTTTTTSTLKHSNNTSRKPNNSSSTSATRSLSYESFQTFLKTRRTTSNFIPLNDLSISQQHNIHDAITRSVECAIQAPNHYRTEPTTYYRIKPNTSSWEKLLDIVYNVTLIKGGRGANGAEKTEQKLNDIRIKAETKRDKWRKTVGGYVVVCVGGQPLQDHQSTELPMQYDNDDDNVNANMSDDMMINLYETLPTFPPETETQLEDYASACASIQNILLSLHSEGLAAKVNENQKKKGKKKS